MCMPQSARPSWQGLEKDSIRQREHNCRVTLSRILGGDPLDADEPYPRIGLCLGGASHWDTPISCVAFLDGLSVPLHASSTQAGTNGAKIIDTISTISCSGPAAWVCGATLATATFAAARTPKASSEQPDCPLTTPFHGTLTVTGPASPWEAWEALHAQSPESITDTGDGLDTPEDMGGPAAPSARRHVHTHFRVQPRNPWFYGPCCGFQEAVHTYNGLVEIFSRRYLSEAAEFIRVRPIHRVVTAAALGRDLIVPGAVLNPALGDSTMARWTTFLRNVWVRLGQNVHVSSHSASYAQDASAADRAHTATSALEEANALSVPFLGPAVSEVVQSGKLPFMIFCAIDVQSQRTLRAITNVGEGGRSWCGPSLRWMEFTPLYVRAASPLCRMDGSEDSAGGAADPCEKRIPHPDQRAFLQGQGSTIHVDMIGADEIPHWQDFIDTSASSPSSRRHSRHSRASTSSHDDHFATDSAVDSRRTTLTSRPDDEPLCLHHVLSLSASGLPLTIVEQGYAYLLQRGAMSEANASAFEPAVELGTGALLFDDDEPGFAASAAHFSRTTSVTAEGVDVEAVLGDSFTSPPPSPRLLSSVVEGTDIRLPWAAVPLYVRHTQPPGSGDELLFSTGHGGEDMADSTDMQLSDSSLSSEPSVAALRASAAEIPTTTPAEAPRELFAMCRDPTMSFRAPLPSLLAPSAGRAFDIVIVHDTAPSSHYPRIPESLARAVELGFYELDERFAADSSLSVNLRSGGSSSATGSQNSSLVRPFDAKEVVRVFHGAPGHPTILYFFGLPGRRCLEAALDGEQLREGCQEVRALVMDHLTPALIQEARRWRYLRKSNFQRLSPMQERSLRGVATRFAVIPPPAFPRGNTPMDEIWERVCRRDAVYESSTTHDQGRQMVVDYTAVEITCLFDMELKGVRDQISTLEFYNMVGAVVFEHLPAAPRARMMQRLRGSALHYLSSGGEARAWHPLTYFFPTMDEGERRVLRMALHFNVFQWRRVPVCAKAEARRHFKGDLHEPTAASQCLGDRPGEDIVEVSLRPFSAVFFAFGALLSVFRPEERRLFEAGEIQVGSISDFYRIEWLRSNQSIMLIYVVCLGSLYLGAWAELVVVLSDVFAGQITAFLDTLQRREQRLRREERRELVFGCAPPKTILELTEDEMEIASKPVPTPDGPGVPCEADSGLDQSGFTRPGAASGPGTPPGIAEYATSAVHEPKGSLSLHAFCTALALTVEAISFVDAEGGLHKATELLDRVNARLRRSDSGSTMSASCVISAPASLTRGCYLTYGQLFLTELMMAIAQNCYSATFFKQMYEYCVHTFFRGPAATPVPNGEAKFFWLHITEALCGNVSVSVRLQCQTYLLSRIHADLKSFARVVASPQPSLATVHHDTHVANLWSSTHAGETWSPGNLVLREAYAYVLPNVLSLLVRHAKNDVNGFLSVLTTTPSVVVDPRTQSYRLTHTIHLFLAHGWTDWRFFCFMVRTLVARHVHMRYLTPAVYQMVIPSYVDHPLACATAVKYAAQCRRLLSVTLQDATASNAGRPSMRTSLTQTWRSEESPNAAHAGTPVQRRLSSNRRDAPCVLSLKPRVDRCASVTSSVSQQLLDLPMSDSLQEAQLEADLLAHLDDGAGASREQRASAARARTVMPAELQPLLDKALRCAEENTEAIRQRPSSKVDKTISTMVSTGYF